MHELFAKTTLVHRKPIRVCWIISSSLCVGHTKRCRISQDCFFFDWYLSPPSADWFGMSCARISYSKKRTTNFQTVQSSKQKIMKQLRLLQALSLRNPFDEVYNGQGQFYLDEKTDRGFTDTPNPGIHNLTYLPNRRQRPAFYGTTKQSRAIVSRPVNTKDFGFLGVGRGSQRSFKLHGLQITWVPSWTDISFSRSSRWPKHSKSCRISFPT